MAIPKRNATVPGTYFVTSRTGESRALFLNGAVCEIFSRTLSEYRVAGIYLLHVFVLMPEHVHVLLTPAGTLERAVMHMKGGSARRIRQELGLRFPVWQRGFSDHRICFQLDDVPQRLKPPAFGIVYGTAEAVP